MLTIYYIIIYWYTAIHSLYTNCIYTIYYLMFALYYFMIDILLHTHNIHNISYSILLFIFNLKSCVFLLVDEEPKNREEKPPSVN